MAVLALLALLQSDEDPRAKAVREAYEEQLGRERVLPGLRIIFVPPLHVPKGLVPLDVDMAHRFLKIWAGSEHVLPELYASLGGRDLDEARSAVHQLNQLWGRRSPLPQDAASLERIRRDWEAWRKDPRPAPCGHSDADVRSLIGSLAHDAIDERLTAARALEPCAFRHRVVLQEALRETKDVEAAARLRALSASIVPGLLGEEGRGVLRKALDLFAQSGDEAEVAAWLRSERARFPGHHAKTLDLVLPALER